MVQSPRKRPRRYSTAIGTFHQHFPTRRPSAHGIFYFYQSACYFTMGREAISVTEALSELAKTKTAALRVHFPGKTVAEPGANLTPTEAKDAPTLSVANSALKPTPTRYVAISLDLAAPFTSFSPMSPVLHDMQADLTAGAGVADGWTPLETTAKPLALYIGPGPPKPSSAHRYVFIGWEQTEGVDSGKIRASLGFSEDVGIVARVRWDQQAFEKKLGLGQAIASTYFLSHS